MKYSPVIRMLNVVLHGVLLCAFAVLGVYYAFFAGTTMFPVIQNSNIYSLEQPYALVLNFSVIGLACATVCGFGLFYSIKSLLNANDDELVVKSFMAYIALGYVVSVMLFLNAAWLVQFTAGNQIPFVTILYSVFTIVALIATNVPFVKLLEDANTNKTMLVLSGAASAISLSLLVSLAAALIPYLTRPIEAGFQYTTTKFYIYIAIAALMSALSVCSYVFFGKSAKANAEGNVLASNLFSGSIVAGGLFALAAGFTEYFWYAKSYKCSFLTYTRILEKADVRFCVISWILGGLFILGGIALIVLNYVKPAKKKPASF